MIKRRVLIVDDDAAILEVLEMRLGTMGFEVTATTDPQRAMAARRWARDRERLLMIGETFASSGVAERILDAVVQAAVDTTEAERSVVFQLTGGRLVPMASAGSPPTS